MARKVEVINVTVPVGQRSRLMREARREGVTLSRYVRERLDVPEPRAYVLSGGKSPKQNAPKQNAS